MKRKELAIVVVVVILIGWTAGLNAQDIGAARRFRLGLQVELNATSLRFSGDCHKVGRSFGVVFEEQYSRNYTVAAITEVSLRENLWLSSGVEYASKGWNSATDVRDFETGATVSSRETLRMRYLQVPLLFNVSRRNAYIGVGGYWGYALSGRETSNQEGVEPVRFDFGSSREDLYSGTDYGVRVKAGYRMKREMSVFVQYQQGFANQIPRDSAAANRANGLNTEARHRAVGVGVSYLF